MTDYPEDLSYTTDHEWVKVGNESIARVGITSYAAEALGDIVFVSLPGAGDEVNAGDAVAELESTKSVSEVFAPVQGVVCAVNTELEDHPELVSQDPFGAGWLFEIELGDPAQLEDLLDANTYTGQLD
ncbi:MAG: glycine cleavage system protein GcvH [Propionibacteriaceae bacterium]|jgi:glycine cleavage system H protein|nr:glycine cleavage system protein GcvH [Propionibacteriaceae bacterium]